MTVGIKARLQFNHFGQMSARTRHIGDDILVNVAEQVITEMERSMEAKKSGAVYSGHVSSAPGEAPASDSEELYYSLERTDPEGDHIYVYSEAEHAPHLEFGTVNMEARPFMFPAIEKTAPYFEKEIARQIKEALK